MKVFVEPSAFTAHNIGDWAMLAVALDRVYLAWPDACVTVNYSDPRLGEAYPSVHWERAPQLRSALQAAAEEQEGQSRAAYRRLFEVVSQARSTPLPGKGPIRPDCIAEGLGSGCVKSADVTTPVMRRKA